MGVGNYVYVSNLNNIVITKTIMYFPCTRKSSMDKSSKLTASSEGLGILVSLNMVMYV